MGWVAANVCTLSPNLSELCVWSCGWVFDSYYVGALHYFYRKDHVNKKYPDGVVTAETYKEGDVIGERITMLDCEDRQFPVRQTCGQCVPRVLCAYWEASCVCVCVCVHVP